MSEVSSTPRDLNTVFARAMRFTNTVVLGTAIVRVQDQQECFQDVKVLLDSGSQISAMTYDCALRLNLPIQ